MSPEQANAELLMEAGHTDNTMWVFLLCLVLCFIERAVGNFYK